MTSWKENTAWEGWSQSPGWVVRISPPHQENGVPGQKVKSMNVGSRVPGIVFPKVGDCRLLGSGRENYN
jgi:hypothetical protein